jgi:hypothetical protein
VPAIGVTVDTDDVVLYVGAVDLDPFSDGFAAAEPETGTGEGLVGTAVEEDLAVSSLVGGADPDVLVPTVGRHAMLDEVFTLAVSNVEPVIDVTAVPDVNPFMG